MKKKAVLITLLGLATPAAMAATGDMPVPTFTSATVTSAAIYDSLNTCIDYSYSVTNSATNTGSIYVMRMDLSTPYTYIDPSTCQIPLTIPRLDPSDDFSPNADLLLGVPHQGHVLLFGETVPTGWMGTVDSMGWGGFGATATQYLIAPGQTMTGFQIQSSNPPTIKQMRVEPWWVFESAGDPSVTDTIDAAQARKNLVVTIPVIGPSSFFPGSEDHWNQFATDINSMIQMGWISDTAFGQKVLSQVAAARTLNDSQGSAYITPALNTLLVTITGSTSSQRNEAAYDLLLLNTQALITFAQPPNSVPPTQQSNPKALIISPDPQSLTLNTAVTIKAQVVDQAKNNAPIPNYPMTILVQGRNSHYFNGTSDSNGMFTATYTGKNAGSDYIYLNTTHGELYDDGAKITWNGGPDLTIKYFVPPIIQWHGSGTIHFTENTWNIGNATAGPSITRYYVSATQPVDPASAEVVGERSVPALAPGDDSDNGGIDLPLPPDLPQGTVYLLACADATNVVAETNELNNCQSNTIAMPVQSPFQPPICTAATPSMSMLWPPNHKMVDITINGVTDPNNLVPIITITGIQQDEPVNSAGDGNTEPDGTGIGTAVAQVRSERSGIAEGGRLYFVAFKAADSKGGSCTGSVAVGVPHDKGQANMPVDNGQRYDSTASQ